MDPQSFIKEYKNPKNIGIFIAVALLFAAMLFYAIGNVTNNRNSGTNDNGQNSEETGYNIPYTIVYGAWKTDGSVVKALNLETGSENVVATLPVNIKKVTPLTNSRLLYIDDTNEADHGSRLTIKDLTSGEEETLYEPSTEFGIDDYAISPDGTYVVTWEAVLSEYKILLGGKSRVVAISTDTKESKQIIEQTANTPVYYPLAVTNTGEIFLDQFLPNSGAGWAYGMATASYTDPTIQTLSNMQNGTYGTQPRLSPDGRLLAFSGYSGTDGAQTKNGFRIALAEPNTVEILDTTTKERIALENVDPENIYVYTKWSQNNISYTTLSRTPSVSGQYLYSLETNQATKIDKDKGEVFIDRLDNTHVILGRIPNSLSNAEGNLGSTYAPLYKDLILADSNSKTVLDTTETLIQMIDVVRNEDTTLATFAVSNSRSNNTERDDGNRDDALQLDTFPVKEELVPTRRAQQSDPPPPEIPVEIPTEGPTRAPNDPQPQPTEPVDSPGVKPAPKDDAPKATPTPDTRPFCADLLSGACGQKPENSLNCDSNGSCTSNPDSVAYNECKGELFTSGTCQGSPLYLYGPKGLSVDIDIHTPIYNAAKGIKQSFTAILNSLSSFVINNQQFESLDFDYQAAIRTRPPLYGTVVNKKDVETVVRDYSNRLGLNNKETEDLVKDIKAKTVKDYVFFSFYTQDQSKYILPISFDPKPDTYINYVFYLRNLDTPYDLGYSPKEPEFEKTERKGEFVAVEISVDAY